jgi:hypothetical protein
MKKHTMVFFMALSTMTAVAQKKQDAEPYQVKSLANSGINQVFVNTSGGSITVTGVDPSQARIEVYINPNNNSNVSKEELKQRLDENYTLEISDNNHELRATAKSKKNNMDWRKAVSVSFSVYVPKLAATNLATSGGSIKLANLTGEQNFATSGGSLNLTNLSGKIKGRTSGGSINVEGCKKDIDLVTSGGSITASNCEGNLSLVTSGGSLKLNNLNGNVMATTSGGSVSGNNITGALNASTSGGSVNLKEMACNIESSTSAGSIHVDMKAVGKYVKLNTSAGNIDIKMPLQGLNLDLKGSKVNAVTGNFDGIKEKDKVEGKLNGGGVGVQAHASNGSVSLTFE